jgi:hypothetical protein
MRTVGRPSCWVEAMESAQTKKAAKLDARPNALGRETVWQLCLCATFVGRYLFLSPLWTCNNECRKRANSQILSFLFIFNGLKFAYFLRGTKDMQT